MPTQQAHASKDPRVARSHSSGGLLLRALWTRWSRLPSGLAPRGRTDEERAYYALNEGVYARLAGAYDLTVRPVRKLRRDVVELSVAGSDAKVLDVATGTGEQARAFALKCREVVGIDLSEAMLAVARAKSPLPNLSYLRADATHLPFADSSFDVATISFALHEMPARIREAVLDEMVRVTKPDGTLVVVDYGLPRNRLGRKFVYEIVRFYEDDHYGEFVQLDLGAVLARKGIELRDERSVLAGAARVWVGVNALNPI
jgi:ubiquinone/menaquinone biosynthesis C-methylase UbiE